MKFEELNEEESKRKRIRTFSNQISVISSCSNGGDSLVSDFINFDEQLDSEDDGEAQNKKEKIILEENIQNGKVN